MKTTGALWQEYLDSWPKGQWFDDSDEHVGEFNLTSSDYVLKPTDVVEFSYGTVYKKEGDREGVDLVRHFKAWRRKRSTSEVVCTVPKAELDRFKDMPEKETSDLLHGLCNAAVTTKVKEWEAQGAVARVDGYYGGRCVITPLNTAAILPTGMALYTHALPAQPAEPAKDAGLVADGCVWTQDSDFEMGDTYDSGCGEKWSFIDGGPAENNVRFCQGCGKPVKLAASPKIGGV